MSVRVTEQDRPCCVCGGPRDRDVSACKKCDPVWHICFTSVDEAIRFRLPKASLKTLWDALGFERTHSRRATLIAAIKREMRKREKAVAP